MPSVKKQMPRKGKPKRGIIGRIGPIKLRNVGLTLSLYGKSGTGKTVLACTCPKKALLIGTEDGTKSVYNVKGLDFVSIAKTEELGEVIKHVVDAGYKSVILDTATMLQDMVLKEILGLEELPAQGSWGMASREDWGTCALQTKERLRSLLRLAEKGINVIIIAQERAFDVENEGELITPTVGSALSPSVTGWLNPACDYIGQTYIRRRVITKKIKMKGKVKTVTREVPGKVDYCLRVGPDPVFTTKFRKPKGSELPESIVDPTFDKILALIVAGG